MVRVKICGLRSVAQASAAEAAGADLLGLNFWPGTPRRIDVETAAAIVAATSVPCVGVFVDASVDEVRRVRAATGLRWVQLHGEEPPETLAALQPEAYKALGVASAKDVAAAARYGGEEVLLDARVPGAPGGTGVAFDWSLAVALAKERRLILAGGLRPENVAEAVRRVQPWGVDVASGVESSPGVKDEAAMRAFVAAAKGL